AAAGINNGDLITAIAYNKGTAGNFLIPAQYTIRMGNTLTTPPLTGTIASDWPTILATHTTVFTDNNFNIPATAGWVTITLNTPFLYTGGSLEISSEQEMTGGSTGATDKFTWEYTTGFSDYIIGEAAGSNSNLSTYMQRPNIRITHMAGTPCTGTPTAGTASITPATRPCASAPFTLSITGMSIGGGISIQWQRSDAGANNFSDITGATSSSYTVTNPPAASDDRCIVICTHSNSTDTSNVVTMAQPSLISNLSENFDTTPVGTGSKTGANYPDCWSYIDSTTTGYGYVIASNPQSSPRVYRLYRANTASGAASEEIVLVSPQTDNLGNGTKQLRFSVRSYSTTTYDNKLEILSMPDPTTTTGATVLTTINNNGQVWQEYVVPLPAGTDDYFAFRLAYPGTTTASSVTIDDVYYEDLETCMYPDNVAVSNVTQSG